MFARTARLLLRPVWPEDWSALFEAINDEGIVCNLARAPWPYTADDARHYAALPQNPKLPHFLLTLPGDNGQRLIGSCGLGDRDGRAELGYWIAREHWGNGYAAEAGLYVCEMARLLGHKRLIAGHFIDNPASGRVLQKIGFRTTGKITQRYSAGRGIHVQSVEFARILESDDGSDGSDDDMQTAMAA